MSEPPLMAQPDALPSGFAMRAPGPDDLADLAGLLTAHQQAARGTASVDPATLAATVTGTGSWTRRHAVLEDGSGHLAAWASVHDRAAGRTVIEVTVAPDSAEGDLVAATLFDWSHEVAVEMARLRGLPSTQLDSGAYADDARQQRWLGAAGYHQTRTWLQMSRPVTPAEAGDGVLPGPRPGVTVRRVAKHDDGMPLAHDLQTVHLMLEESFADHFNSYRESFPEFAQRLREDPGHRWDHWWIAGVESDGEVRPGGALVGSVLPPDGDGVEGSYIDYIGVHRRARGRGVAKALLHTVIRDAAERGRNRVGLEVDADSPTGADGLYTAMGWETAYRTQSWHRDAPVAESGETGTHD